jgi:DNA-directed RNA polymerase sigma subunit (sigma70/sigma32)
MAYGQLALVKAAASWNPARAKFSTLACTIIRRDMIHEANAWETIRLPHNMPVSDRMLKRKSCELLREADGPWTPTAPVDESEADLDVDVEVLENALEYLRDRLPGHYSVMAMLYGLTGDRTPIPIKAVAKAKGISPDRVREIKNRSIGIIRWHAAR